LVAIKGSAAPIFLSLALDYGLLTFTQSATLPVITFAVLRQLGDVGRDPPRLIFAEQLGCGSLLRPNSPHTPEDQRQDDRRDDNCKASGID
jgi:hypothetical protein